jgi:FMN-dependent NADH-azoreductase
MPTLLHLDSSPMPNSVSRELTAEFVRTWKAAHPDGAVITRDVAANPSAPLDVQWIYANFTPEAARTPEQRALLASSTELIAELKQADEYVIGVAMHNFSIPSTLKLWVDQIARVGLTFAYGANGPEGLLKGKKATILIATGGSYEIGTPLGGLNFIEPYLKAFFGFLGITDVQFVTASGAAQLMSPDADRAAFLKPTIERVRTIAA